MTFADVTIRPAQAGDARLIYSWILRERLDPTAMKWKNFLIAELDGQVVGIGQIKHFPDCDELGSLITAPQQRGRGIATRLIAALEQGARHPLYLVCHARMEPYYVRFGFQTIRWRDYPRSLKIKTLLPLLVRLFGVRVLVMRKE
jgi:amino-acid N-acetyltransferase